MYKSFAKTMAEAWRQRGHDQARSGAEAGAGGGGGLCSPKFAGMHAARCYLGALSVYEGSGWRAAEQYAYTVLPTEVRLCRRTADFEAYRGRLNHMGSISNQFESILDRIGSMLNHVGSMLHHIRSIFDYSWKHIESW